MFNVVYFLVKHYGENARREIASSGPGLGLLIEENLNNERVLGLVKQGVRFYAFRNTHYKVNNVLDREKLLNCQASLVQGGALRIIKLVKKGIS